MNTSEDSGIQKEITFTTPQGEVASITDVPFSVIQALYHEAAGKTEKTIKTYDSFAHFTFDDFEQLHFKLLQILEHYDVRSPTITVELEFENTERERLSSWEKFKLFDTSRTEATSEVNIDYEFLLQVPRVKRPHRYKISLAFRSTLCEQQKTNETLPLRMRHIMYRSTIFVSIEYVDYLISRAIVKTVDDWAKSLTTLNTRFYFPSLQQNSHLFRVLFSRVGLLFSLLCSYLLFFQFELNAGFDAISAINWLALSSAIGIVTSIIGWVSGDKLQDFVNSFTPLSIIQLTRGDSQLYEKRFSDQAKLLTKGAVTIIAYTVALGLNVFGAYIYDRLVE